jgi:hypothetical protein
MLFHAFYRMKAVHTGREIEQDAEHSGAGQFIFHDRMDRLGGFFLHPPL